MQSPPLFSFHHPQPLEMYPLCPLHQMQHLRTGLLTAAERWQLLAQNEDIHASKTYTIHPAWMGGIEEMKELLHHPQKKFVDADQNWVAGAADYMETVVVKTRIIRHPLQMLSYAQALLAQDLAIINLCHPSAAFQPVQPALYPGVHFIDPDQIFVRGQVQILPGTVLNASSGMMVLDDGVQIMENNALRGPLYLGRHSVVKMGSALYGPIITEEKCTLGGEVKAVWLGKGTNKGHYGYLGDSVLGRWCNLGAGTTNSNVKNTASAVRLWNEQTQTMKAYGPKAGLLMGSHSRSAINTSFNTGTVVGPGSNIFGPEMPPAHLAPFSWGLDGSKYEWAKALEHIRQWMAFKQEHLMDTEEEELKTYYEKYCINKPYA